MGMYSWYFGSSCGSSNNTVTCTYIPETNKIQVYGCFGEINFVNDFPNIANTHRIDIIPSYRVDGDGLNNYLDSVNDYAIASRSVNLGDNEPVMEYFNWTVQGTWTPQQYLERVNGQSQFQLLYLNYTVNQQWNGGSLVNINVNTSAIPAIPATPTFVVSVNCNDDTSIPNIQITSGDENITYWSIQRSASSGGTYTEIGKLYVSGGTNYYNDTSATGNTYWYKIKTNLPWEISSVVKEYNYNTAKPTTPNIIAAVVPSDYPTLTFTAETLNFCADYDGVNWYLDGSLIGTSAGSTYTGVLPNQVDYFHLTAKHVKNSILSDFSGSVALNFSLPILSGFTGNGTMVIPSGYTRMDYLVVAGGGGGGGVRVDETTFDYIYGMGGGAGGAVIGTITNPVAGSYNVIVGTGGSAGSSGNRGNSGTNSSFYGLTAIGGGGGAGQRFNTSYDLITSPCLNGGSGGGGGCSGIVGQGNDGGTGGGGGAGSVGFANNGGAGISSSIGGTSETYSEGGYRTGPILTTNGSGGRGTTRLSIGTSTGVAGNDGIVYVKLYNLQQGAPLVPTNNLTSSLSCTGVTLNWTNNNVSGVTGNYIQLHSGDTWVIIADVSSGTTSYVLTGLIPNTEYRYKVCAYNDIYIACGNEIILQTLNPAPFNLVAGAGAGFAVINWQLNDLPFGNGIRPEIRLNGTSVWTSGSTIATDALTHTFTGLNYNTSYQCRFVRLGSEYPSEILDFQTPDFNPPSFLTTTSFSLTKITVSWVNNETYDNLWIVINGKSTAISSSATGHTFTDLIPNTVYSIYVRAEKDTIFGNSVTIVQKTLNFLPSFCENPEFSVSASTCGNQIGEIIINNPQYMELYDFNLVDIWGNSYNFNTITGKKTGLNSGFYTITATVKSKFWFFYGRDTCVFNWISVEDSNNPIILDEVSITPMQCQPFDIQYGRIFYKISGLITGNTYSFYAFTKDLRLYHSQTGITSANDFILRNSIAQCYWVIIKDEVTGCTLLIPNQCVPSKNVFSLGGIKKLWIAKWSNDIDYNYWKTSDEDYFLEFEDTSFFNSTKIKEYQSLSGGTIQWYEIQVLSKVFKLSQKLDKVRQGFVLTDTLELAIPKANAEKWTKVADIINPENKWIGIIIDANDFAWTFGYRHGARISGYSYKTGAREEDNGYNLQFTAVSETKLLTSIDKNYIINNV